MRCPRSTSPIRRWRRCGSPDGGAHVGHDDRPKQDAAEPGRRLVGSVLSPSATRRVGGERPWLQTTSSARTVTRQPFRRRDEAASAARSRSRRSALRRRRQGRTQLVRVDHRLPRRGGEPVGHAHLCRVLDRLHESVRAVFVLGVVHQPVGARNSSDKLPARLRHPRRTRPRRFRACRDTRSRRGWTRRPPRPMRPRPGNRTHPTRTARLPRQLLAQLVAVGGAPLVELVDELIALEARLLGGLRALHSPCSIASTRASTRASSSTWTTRSAASQA